MLRLREEEKSESIIVHTGQIISHSPTVRCKRRREEKAEYRAQDKLSLTDCHFFDNKNQPEVSFQAKSMAYAYLIRRDSPGDGLDSERKTL